MKNFLSNYSPVWPRMNRARYIKYLLLFILIYSLVTVIFAVTTTIFFYWDEVAGKQIEEVFILFSNIPIIYVLIALWFRRLHDFNFRGLWILFPFSSFIICFIPWTKWPNWYWPDPLEKQKIH